MAKKRNTAHSTNYKITFTSVSPEVINAARHFIILEKKSLDNIVNFKLRRDCTEQQRKVHEKATKRYEHLTVISSLCRSGRDFSGKIQGLVKEKLVEYKMDIKDIPIVANAHLIK